MNYGVYFFRSKRQFQFHTETAAEWSEIIAHCSARLLIRMDCWTSIEIGTWTRHWPPWNLIRHRTNGPLCTFGPNFEHFGHKIHKLFCCSRAITKNCWCSNNFKIICTRNFFRIYDFSSSPWFSFLFLMWISKKWEKISFWSIHSIPI